MNLTRPESDDLAGNYREAVLIVSSKAHRPGRAREPSRASRAPFGGTSGGGVRHSIVTDHENDPLSEPSEDVERRGSDRRAGVDRRKHDSGAPDGAEKRKGERRKGERRTKKEPDQ